MVELFGGNSIMICFVPNPDQQDELPAAVGIRMAGVYESPPDEATEFLGAGSDSLEA